MNILFIMYDQLRFDYLSCAGHPHLKTPHFDRVADMGVRFTNAYVQSPICGASRMCFYTGRYASSHGAQWNGFPLRVGEQTLGDHLRSTGMDCWLIGKTHMKADAAGMARLGLAPDSLIGARQAECGFDSWIRDDGLWGYGPDGYYDEKRSPYNEYLKSKGYDGENPWADYANAGISDDQIASGWMFRNADKPANIREEDSETPWLTSETIAFMDQAKGPWCAHVSYIKPHWPYIVPAPYHDMFGKDHVPEAKRHNVERDTPHPVFGAYMENKIAQAFQRDEVREKVIPAYMGLIKQCDDQLGRLLSHLEQTDKLKDTMIVLTADHGDYLGDHWLGEKDLFHEQSVKVPMIIFDPRDTADSTRGTTCDALVESIDLAATFVEAAGGVVPDHIIEGRSLLPWLRGETPEWRAFAISEYDYSATPQAVKLGVSPRDARLFMVFDGRYKMMHAEGGFRPMLFDLQNDPDEFEDLAKGDAHGEVLDRMYGMLAQWGRRMSQRVTRSEQDIIAMRGASGRKGILPFLYDGSEVPEELTETYRGPVRQTYTSD
ncbi:sulfatase-like hydrolase/transferase [Sulfitobacter sp. M57]|uniref:sulfatase-like hydrolase/transferase n=1 Tax=unclassified Sulfitobacter TaxID=196795 RepID=UPI0023E27FD9|nr:MULTISPECIES: sulfatase-like hydrolase/transferase [unclassified Sulfitobacter]MDF3415917.1 sulfatase-like hydrolase/transferase [Sulfitobacter sp. KE5]MDF3423397.1 sulfatase-like hydrolase/transferase [Sulfitobacter sp. KE43]MDF3434463.1 sulfatase-like hydrolase/transferase [Sulfitobacter sp. KE42]MDF3460103.1 sulfatase-like hydrolase/transferase [Sulfitobacter sp. S74]MDF3464001.1 sulfatase-like hydrolase/transferase [Sulfitobacter sp. Ks18]